MSQARTHEDACGVCGGREFAHTPVLWPQLVAEWGLSNEEAGYIDVQQGTHCVSCGANIRMIALARAIVTARGFNGLLTDFVADAGSQDLRLLEINTAGTLNAVLSRLPGHTLVAHPPYDMMHLTLPDGGFDLVVHSDTLEHVADPLKGLQECHRVLAADGALVFTVPIVAGRLNRSRAGLPRSHHGEPAAAESGMLVHTEFGADVWTLVIRAGFSRCEFVAYRFPAGLALVARR
jgi:SAM-dependent methyltransferase